MSAAVWSETADPLHQQLPPVTIARDQLPGRPRRDSIILRIWGATPHDRELAEADARKDTRLYRFHIASVEQADAPITSAGDAAVIVYGTTYDRTWAAYPAIGAQGARRV